MASYQGARRSVIGIIGRIRRKAAKKKKRQLKEQQKQALRDYRRYFETLPIDENLVVMEARNGRTIDGNNFYIARQLLTNEAYSHLKVHIVAFDPRAAASIRARISPFAGDRAKIVIIETDEYFRLMATAKYIVNDSAIKNFYIKKDGQVYMNVWHGTPLKTMGKRVWHEPHAVGSVQKNFVMADYLLYPSTYMRDHMIEDYMISDISKARIIMAGYPRNSIFFDEAARDELRRQMAIDNKKVYAYMPTYRPEEMKDVLAGILRDMDDALTDDELMFVNIHPLAKEGVDFESYSSIRPFPEDREVYDFLNACDALITDYSSVFYDFAVSGRKILLYTYDEEDYFKTRGLYEPLSSLPFPNCKDLDRLFEELRAGSVSDRSEFLEKYCSYESRDASSLLCRQFFLGEDLLTLREMPSNGLENILVHNGELTTDERRSALLDELKKLDPAEANYYVFFNRRDLKDDPRFPYSFPDGIRFFGRTGYPVFSREQEEVKRQYEEGLIPFEEYWDKVKDTYALEKRRYLGDAPIHKVIQLPPGPGICPEATEMELELASYL